MRQVLIVLGGDAPPQAFILETARRCDAVVCADSGLEAALAAGLRVDAAIGDFDSVSENTLAAAQSLVGELTRLPCEKDDTDGMAALRYALAHGAQSVVFVGAWGGRMDHALANLQLLLFAENQGVEAVAADPGLRVWAKRNTIQIDGKPGDLVSVLPMDGNVMVHAMDGLYYTLNDQPVPLGTPVGVSNVMTGPVARIEISSGWAAIFHYGK